MPLILKKPDQNSIELHRFIKLAVSISSGSSNKKFLKDGDVIEVSGGVLGAITVKIAKSPDIK